MMMKTEDSSADLVDFRYFGQPLENKLYGNFYFSKKRRKFGNKISLNETRLERQTQNRTQVKLQKGRKAE